MKVWGTVKIIRKIGINKKDEVLGLTIHFNTSEWCGSSLFTAPCDDISHAGDCYLRDRGFRIKSEFQRKYFNKRYKEIVKEYYEMIREVQL